MPPTMSIQMRVRSRHHAVDEVDAHVLVHLERVGRAEQHHAGEHVPLDFQPGVRALAEQIAAAGVAGADISTAARMSTRIIGVCDPIFSVHGVDRRADLQQTLQEFNPRPVAASGGLPRLAACPTRIPRPPRPASEPAS